MKKLSEIELDTLLNELIEELNKNFKDNFTGLVLFGSYAKGKATDYSDIDLLLTFKKFSCRYVERFDLILPILINIEKKYKIQLNPVIKQLNELTISFLLSEIFLSGIVHLDKTKDLLNFKSRLDKAIDSGLVKKIGVGENYKLLIENG